MTLSKSTMGLALLSRFAYSAHEAGGSHPSEEHAMEYEIGDQVWFLSKYESEMLWYPAGYIGSIGDTYALSVSGVKSNHDKSMTLLRRLKNLIVDNQEVEINCLLTYPDGVVIGYEDPSSKQEVRRHYDHKDLAIRPDGSLARRLGLDLPTMESIWHEGDEVIVGYNDVDEHNFKMTDKVDVYLPSTDEWLTGEFLSTQDDLHYKVWIPSPLRLLTTDKRYVDSPIDPMYVEPSYTPSDDVSDTPEETPERETETNGSTRSTQMSDMPLNPDTDPVYRQGTRRKRAVQQPKILEELKYALSIADPLCRQIVTDHRTEHGPCGPNAWEIMGTFPKETIKPGDSNKTIQKKVAHFIREVSKSLKRLVSRRMTLTKSKAQRSPLLQLESKCH